MIYTAPIKNNDKEVGVLYATERGQVDDVYYSYKIMSQIKENRSKSMLYY